MAASELVHHKDGNPENDDPENLEILTRSEHTRRHWMEGSISGRLRLSYGRIAELMEGGLGYKRIAAVLGENVNTVKSACQKIRLGRK